MVVCISQKREGRKNKGGHDKQSDRQGSRCIKVREREDKRKTEKTASTCTQNKDVKGLPASLSVPFWYPVYSLSSEQKQTGAQPQLQPIQNKRGIRYHLILKESHDSPDSLASKSTRRIRQELRFLLRPHLGSKLTLPVQIELLHQSIIRPR